MQTRTARNKGISDFVQPSQTYAFVLVGEQHLVIWRWVLRVLWRHVFGNKLPVLLALKLDEAGVASGGGNMYERRLSWSVDQSSLCERVTHISNPRSTRYNIASEGDGVDRIRNPMHVYLGVGLSFWSSLSACVWVEGNRGPGGGGGGGGAGIEMKAI